MSFSLSFQKDTLDIDGEKEKFYLNGREVVTDDAVQFLFHFARATEQRASSSSVSEKVLEDAVELGSLMELIEEDVP